MSFSNDPADSELPATNNQSNETSNNNDQDLLPEARLEDLPERLRQGVEAAGWPKLMPVQAKAIPYLFAGRDMMIQSRTGSGKTGAYLLPIFELVNPLLPACQALVLVPTRELAVQVAGEAELLGQSTGVHSAAIYGGVSYGPQEEALRRGTQLIIGTPGRILDHLLRRTLNLNKLKILIFDEADRLLSMGFYPDMLRVQSYLPNHPISSYMFSATFPPAVLRLAQQFMQSPGFLNLSSDHIHVTETEHVYYVVPGMDKDRALVRIIEIENPTSALIFANTRVRVHYVAVVLQRYGYDADEISSDLSQVEREKVMTRIREGKLRFMVATDVAARGIDLPELSHVVQYEPPEDMEAYIHRAGRTGRAGGSGVAISLVNPAERVELVRIAKHFTIEMEERPLPTDEDVEKVVTERVIALLEAELRLRDKLKLDRQQRFLPFVRSLKENDNEHDEVAMLLDDFYQEKFHGLPPVPPTDRSPKLALAKRSRVSQLRKEKRKTRRM